MLNQIITFLSKIPQDKLLHYFVGSLLAAGLLPFGLLWSALGVGVVAFWREATGNHDGLDFLATMAGGLPVWGAFFLRGLR
jgi:hypothetical protein